MCENIAITGACESAAIVSGRLPLVTPNWPNVSTIGMKPDLLSPAPTLTMSGPTAAVNAGTQNTYSVSLKNNDSSDCGTTSFSLARTVPSGWTGTLSSSAISLAPGATGTATLAVTSPTTAAAGSYGIGLGTSSSVGSGHTANASSTYAVAAAQLTETVTTSKTTYKAGETVSWTARVLKNGVPVADIEGGMPVIGDLAA